MAGERRLYLEMNCRLPESPAHSRRRNREGPASSKGLNSQRGFGPAVEPRRKSRPRSTSLHGSSPCKCQRLSTLRWDRLPPSRPSTKSGARAGGRRLSDRRLHRWLAGTSASAPSSHGAADLLGLNRAHICVRNLFKEVFVVSQATFRTDVESLVASENRGSAITPTAWGHLRHEVLPFTLDLPWTRLYSPDFLERVFNWPVLQKAWDGLLCEVEPPFRVRVRSAKNPRCLKWVSLNDKAILKKSRGITSLWGRATKQIPAGEMGIIYIAYPEGARESLADARTQHIIKTSKQWQARWSVKIPMTVVDRLYSRSLGIGLPDLIESSLLFTLDGDETWLSMFPANVFTKRFP